MADMRFSWDDRKASGNLRKHGVSFEEAATSFEDSAGRLMFDPDHSGQEERFVLLGMSCGFRLLLVVHAYRRKDTEIRIISARKATKSECKQYGSFL